MKHKDLMLLLIPFFVVVLAWVIFNIYHSSTASTVTDSLSIQLSPISPNFDSKTIDEIKKRKVFTPAYEFSASSEADLTPIEVPEGTSGATLQTETNESSSGGSLAQ